VSEVANLVRLTTDRSSTITVHASGHCSSALPADALKQVLLNLVQNSKEAAKKDMEIHIDVATRDEHVVITVTDNGPGVAPEVRNRIFDPFFTTREGAGGVGLGLFVVEGVVRGHGGTVSLVEREDGVSGASFRIELPVAPREERAVTTRKDAGRKS